MKQLFFLVHRFACGCDWASLNRLSLLTARECTGTLAPFVEQLLNARFAQSFITDWVSSAKFWEKHHKGVRCHVTLWLHNVMMHITVSHNIIMSRDTVTFHNCDVTCDHNIMQHCDTKLLWHCHVLMPRSIAMHDNMMSHDIMSHDNVMRHHYVAQPCDVT